MDVETNNDVSIAMNFCVHSRSTFMSIRVTFCVHSQSIFSPSASNFLSRSTQRLRAIAIPNEAVLEGLGFPRQPKSDGMSDATRQRVDFPLDSFD